MLYEGAVKLFDKDQGGSGADLSKLYLENLTTGLAANSILFCFLFVQNDEICMEGKAMTPLSLFSSDPPSNSLVSVSDP